MAVVNQFTRNKDWQRLQVLDATLAKLRKQAQEVYKERVQVAQKLYATSQRGQK